MSEANQETAPAPTGGQFSVVQLGRLHERVLRLREHLRAALLADSPQMEMIIFTAFFDLYQEFYFPLLSANADSSTTEDEGIRSKSSDDTTTLSMPAEARFVASAYTQDFLAACLYLIDPSAVPEKCVLSSRPPPLGEAGNADNASAVYVSGAQRRFCLMVFLFLCWSETSVPLRDVLQALYPLLDPGASQRVARDAATAAASAAENSIAADLFSQPRFAGRKRFLGETLHGLVLSRRHGLRALLRVLLLDDRVEQDMTAEAAQLLVRLLTAPLPAVWTLQDARCDGNTHLSATKDAACGTIVREAPLSVETQIQRIAPQLLALLEEHAEAEASPARVAPARRPHFLARLDAQQQRLPAETLEQRLHLFLTLYLNALVKVPPRTSSDFARSYRQFFYANKFVLTPGFACLSLRSDEVLENAEAAVTAALRRVASIVKGVSLGAGTGALAHVLPAVAAGLLNLCAVQQPAQLSDPTAAGQEKPREDCLRGPADAALRLVCAALLSNSSLYELAAHSLVRVCTSEHRHSFRRRGAAADTSGAGAARVAALVVDLEEVEEAKKNDTSAGALIYGATPCTATTLALGLQWLLGHLAGDTPDFVHACVEAMIETCQLSLYATGVDSLTVADSPNAEDGEGGAATPPLVHLLERLCLEAPSEVVFGGREQLSVTSTLALLGRVLGLSAVLYRWSIGMLQALLVSDSVQMIIAGQGFHPTAAAGDDEHVRLLTRLGRTCQSILATLHLLQGSSTARSGTGPAASAAVMALVGGCGNVDAELMALTEETCVALEQCVAAATKQLHEESASCEALTMCDADGTSRNSTTDVAAATSQNEVVVTVTAQWQRLLEQLQSALDGRSAAEAAMTLAALSRSVDDVVHDVRDPQPLQSVTQPLLLLLTRVLYESDDVGSAARAVHCLAWLGMYRFDSVDSAFLADIAWAVLGEEKVPAWLAAHIGHTAARAPGAAARVCRLQVRWLDVLLAWTDYDSDARTLRNIDDNFRRRRHTALYDVLVRLCQSRSDEFVQVATLHFVGAYTLAVHPRVPLTALCELCRDVFRLSPHEMAKAACAAALGTVVAALCESMETATLLLTEVDLGACQSIASAMSSYRSQAAGSVAGEAAALHDAVIQQHGRDMLQLLRKASLSLESADATPSVLKVEMPPLPPRKAFL